MNIYSRLDFFFLRWFYHNPIKLVWKVLRKAKINQKDHKSIFSSSVKSELISETVILYQNPESVQRGGRELPQAPRIVLTVVRDAGHWDLKNQKLCLSLGNQVVFWAKTGQDLVTTKLNSYTIAWRCWSFIIVPETATQTERKGSWTFIL